MTAPAQAASVAEPGSAASPRLAASKPERFGVVYRIGLPIALWMVFANSATHYRDRHIVPSTGLREVVEAELGEPTLSGAPPRRCELPALHPGARPQPCRPLPEALGLAAQGRRRPRTRPPRRPGGRLRAHARPLRPRRHRPAPADARLRRRPAPSEGDTRASARGRSGAARRRPFPRCTDDHARPLGRRVRPRRPPPRDRLDTEPNGSVFAARLDASFAALSDATRRGVLEQLGRADASITELADRFHMTLTGMKKHVGVLEQAGLVTTREGRARADLQARPGRLAEETAWIDGIPPALGLALRGPGPDRRGT